ncbi:MAG: coproporphyrinogen dehydrogenase HemZ, partial [Clostridiales bacterium]|nr:coproporphyrinogen dehydrogenase HemZ [Clostridiales bacterium]
ASGNLENIGWCKPGFLCVNNVTVMEETLSVYACGAGAIGKAVATGGKILRHAKPKDVLLYLREFEERMAKKEAFYKNIL